jgi:hypothetical protein
LESSENTKKNKTICHPIRLSILKTFYQNAGL